MATIKPKRKVIAEKKLGIPPDYQYKAIRSKNYLQANWHKNKITVIQKLVNFNNDMSVLDLGPGSGNFELAFWSKVKNILAVDYNKEAIAFLNSKISNKKIKNVKTLVEDVRYLHKRKDLGKFDLIIMVDVIEHIRFSDAKNMVTQFKKILTKNGKVMIITPNYKSPWVVIEWLLDNVLTIFPRFEDQHLAKFHRDNLSEIFISNGYGINTLSTFNLFSYLVPSKRLSKLLANLEISLPISFGNLLVGVFSNQV